ncbi:phosphomannomutase/phosphoglucomutase [Helicobacter cetorum]|uniref:Phosphomannomutase n=1 Tax=Helicobacter cetorum (strain ATCC BAA-540 / CCUG 52418 / MIT 99-5656) TaxID=1163745 RepID=I0EQA9_HELCM|nr:phosphomannomutase/phosphoglucomutase [Helicobacter cetorum]AFI05128.1 phosphomannomutase [Helicobacter cetorum MIT 99-5656]
MDTNIFREYDIRGIYPKTLDENIAFSIGVELGKIMQQYSKGVFVGYDARVHGKNLFEALSAGLQQEGLKVYDLGLIPTPVAYFATFNEIDSIQCPNSIMITGSHNPKEYNGFKITINNNPFYGKDIQALKDTLLNATQNATYKIKPLKEMPLKVNALEAYHNYLINNFKHLKDFKHKIALDFGNGVGALGLVPILKALNIDFDSLYSEPDGNFPNHHPDPSETKNLQDLKAHMQENAISIGFAFDGDADRIAMLGANHIYAGDELAILFAKHLYNQGITPFVIGEVKCSQVMYDTINSFGKTLMYKTGHSNLKVKLKETTAHFAAEMSGHIFFKERYFGYDDALYACLRALELMLKEDPSDLKNFIKNLPYSYTTPEEKIFVSEEEKFEIIQNLQNKLQNVPDNFPKIKEIISIDGVRVVFEHGFGLIRASNTTPCLVTRFEGKDEKTALEYKKALLGLLDG